MIQTIKSYWKISSLDCTLYNFRRWPIYNFRWFPQNIKCLRTTLSLIHRYLNNITTIISSVKNHLSHNVKKRTTSITRFASYELWNYSLEFSIISLTRVNYVNEQILPGSLRPSFRLNFIFSLKLPILKSKSKSKFVANVSIVLINATGLETRYRVTR